MTLGTIIMIVLGVVVLVFLIFGFSTGWNNLWDRVTAFGGGSNNVDTVVQACALRCSSGDEYGFCQEVRKVTLEDGKSASETCKGFTESLEFIKGENTEMLDIGVEPCPELC